MERILAKDELKVGDIIGIRKPVPLDWGVCFRYMITEPEKIARITPKRTKVVTESGKEFKMSSTIFYVVDEEANHKTKIAQRVQDIDNAFHAIEMARRSRALFSVSDESIIKIATLMNEINKEISENSQK